MYCVFILSFSNHSVDEPSATSIFVTIILSLGIPVNLSETPIAVRIFSLLDGALWNCVASFDDTYLDAFRRGQSPVVRVPESVCDDTVNPYTTDARGLCMVHMYAAAIPNLVPDAIPFFLDALQGIGYPEVELGLDEDIDACRELEDYEEFKSCLNDVSAAAEYAPIVVASAIVADMLDYANNNGWNFDGMEGGCQYNCAAYADTTGYQPRNLPGTAERLSAKKSKASKSERALTQMGDKTGSSKSAKKSKGKLDATAKYWQPLLENDGRGFFFRQEHVTPHIGFTAQPRLFSREEIDSRELEDPKYDLVLEAELVTKRLQNLDDETKMLVEHFDNKSVVAGTLFRSLIFRYGFADFTFERVMLWLVVFLSAEEDAVLLAWKEKVRNDLVRPTTVIQQSDRYGTPEEITTWAGPFQDVETFPAGDFQPYIRVMPHAEFPSGSSCICTAGGAAMKAYMMTVFNDDLADYNTLSRSYMAGDSLVEPGVTPAEPLTLVFDDLDDFVAQCGQSRLDGGMHFTASIEAGNELCQGFQPKVEEYILELLNGKDDLITTYQPSRDGAEAAENSQEEQDILALFDQIPDN
ncbi:MAG: hypothetical protein SGILL_005077 [Bacillariaceae sp.]